MCFYTSFASPTLPVSLGGNSQEMLLLLINCVNIQKRVQNVSVSLLHVPLKRQQTEERKQKHNALYSWLSLFVEAQKNSQTLCLFTRSFDYFWGFGASFCVFCLLFYYNCLITWIWRLQKGSNQTCGAPQCDSWSFFFLSFYFYDFKQGNTPASVPHIYSNVVS